MSESIQRPETFSEHTVIDTDVHLSARSLARDDALAYLDEPYRSHVERGAIERDGWDREMGDKIDRRRLTDPETIKRELCERYGIDIPVLSPSLQLQRVPDSDVAVHLMRALNNVLLDKFLDYDEAFRGLASLDVRKPDRAAEELDRLGDESQVAGAIIVPTGVAPPLGDPKYDVIYRAAQDNGLPIAFHAAAGAFHLEFPIQHRGFEKFVEAHTMAHLWSQTMTMMSLLTNGTQEKFPDLPFSFLELGVSWLPIMMFRLNKEYSIRRQEMPLLERSPEEYIRDFYISSQPLGEPNDPTHMEYILEIMDAQETLMFSTDYPHWDFDSPQELAKYLDAHFTEEEKKRVLHDNAAAAFAI